MFEETEKKIFEEFYEDLARCSTAYLIEDYRDALLLSTQHGGVYSSVILVDKLRVYINALRKILKERELDEIATNGIQEKLSKLNKNKECHCQHG